MASIRKKPRSRYWWACITLPNGTRKQFSTELEDEDAARAAAQEAENAARRFQSKPHNLRAAFARIADEIIGQPSVDPLTFLVGWAKTRGPEVEPGTALAYDRVAREAGEWFREHGLATLDAITAAHITRLRDHWTAETSPGTSNNKLKILRSALKYAVSPARHLAANPAEGVGLVKSAAGVRRHFTPAEIQRILRHTTGEWHAMVLLALYTAGQRISDYATLRWTHIDLEAGTLLFTARKTGRTVDMPLMDPVIAAIAELPASDDPRGPVFPGIAALSQPARSNAFRGILADLGLATPIDRYKGKKEGPRSKKRQSSELSFHSFRHSATTFLKASGVSDSIAMAIVGHDSKAVSKNYSHIDHATIRAALAKMQAVIAT